MITPEIIKALKENTSAFGLMSPELQEAAKKIGRLKFQVWEEGISGRSDWKCHVIESLPFQTDQTYRLRADYQPEPRFEKFEVWANGGGLAWQDTMWISEACDEPCFSHFEKDNGNKIGIENIATYIHNGGKVYVVMRK